MKKLIYLLLIITLTSCGSLTLTTYTSPETRTVMYRPVTQFNFDRFTYSSFTWNYDYYYGTPFNNFNYWGYSSPIWLGNVYDRWYWNNRWYWNWNYFNNWNTWRPATIIRGRRSTLRTTQPRLNRGRSNQTRSSRPTQFRPNQTRSSRSTQFRSNQVRRSRSTQIRRSGSTQNQRVNREGRRSGRGNQRN